MAESDPLKNLDAVSGQFDVKALREQIAEDQEMYANGMVFQGLMERRLVDKGLVPDIEAAQRIMGELIGLMIECGYAMVSKQ